MREQEPRARSSWSAFLAPAVGAGLLGLAINLVLPIDLYANNDPAANVDLVLGSVPVLMVAILFGARAGLVAGALAGLSSFVLWGHGLGWVAHALEAAAVGAFARRLHPAAIVLGFWLVVGEPLYFVGSRLLPHAFGPITTMVAIKTPLQELFCVLLAQTLLYLAPLRHGFRRRWPDVRLPVVRLVSFQLTFLSMSILAIAGSMAIVEARGLYSHERETLAHYNQAAANSLAARLETMIRGYDTALLALAAPRWTEVSPAERQLTARHLLRMDGFRSVLWLDQSFHVRSGWALNHENHLISMRPGSDLTRLRALRPPTGPNQVVHEVRSGGKIIHEPFLVMLAPTSGGYVAGVVTTRTLQRQLRTSTPLAETEVLVVDAQGHELFALRQGDGPNAGALLGGLPALRSEAPLDGLGWSVWVLSPEWALRTQVNRAMKSVVPSVLPVLLLLVVLGAALMAVMGQEFRQLRLAAQRVGRAERPTRGLPDTFLLEFRSLYETLGRVSNSLRQTMTTLRTREAELTITNSQLGATVDELKAVERSRGEVLNAISHDIKIPLTAILGYTELLEDQAAGPLNHDQKDYVHGIGENSQRVIRLLEDLLDLTRLEVGRFPIEPQALDLPEALTRTQRNLQPLIDRKNLTMTTDASPEMEPVLADPGRLDQVLNNLVSNAIKFTPEGGHVVLRAYPAPDQRAAVVQVIDDGAGIPPEHLPHLFERFYRVPGTKPGGTGLGLAISKGLVEAMGGTIGVLSEPGQGSTFWFTLPFMPQEQAAEAHAGGERASGPS